VGRAPFEDDNGHDEREDGRYDDNRLTVALPLRTWGMCCHYIVQKAASSAICSATNELCTMFWGVV